MSLSGYNPIVSRGLSNYLSTTHLSTQFKELASNSDDQNQEAPQSAVCQLETRKSRWYEFL